MSKYKYYFKKPRSEVIKDILTWLAVAGAVYIAASSPYFIINLMKAFQRGRKYGNKRLYNAFYQLKRDGCVDIEQSGHKVRIALTEQGRKKAGWLQIDSLEIKKPSRWDGKWRIVIFDIAQMQKLQRNAFRGKLSELGFRHLQKSVWIHPYRCKDEINLLRDFFGLTKKEIRLITAQDIEDDSLLRKAFGLQ